MSIFIFFAENKGVNSTRLVACITTLYLFSKIRAQLMVKHAMTMQPYLTTKCNVSSLPVLLICFFETHQLKCFRKEWGNIGSFFPIADFTRLVVWQSLELLSFNYYHLPGFDAVNQIYVWTHLVLFACTSIVFERFIQGHLESHPKKMPILFSSIVCMRGYSWIILQITHLSVSFQLFFHYVWSGWPKKDCSCPKLVY